MAVTEKESGLWLDVFPFGLYLNNNELRIDVSLLCHGVSKCAKHTCICNESVGGYSAHMGSKSAHGGIDLLPVAWKTAI